MSTPNILLILADDVGVDSLRINYSNRTVQACVVSETSKPAPVTLQTFERLLKHGVCYQNAWAQPVCTPTRVSLWTGTQPWRTGLGYPTFAGTDLATNTVTGEKVQTLAQAIAANYGCGMFGKWDLGTVEHPVKRGWDVFKGIFRGDVRNESFRFYGFKNPGLPAPTGSLVVDINRLENPSESTEPEKCKNAARLLQSKYGADFVSKARDLRYYIWEKDVVEKGGSPRQVEMKDRELYYATEDEVADVKRWVSEQTGPWFAALNLISPHDPFHVPPPGTFTTKFADPAKPTVQEALVAMLESIDHYVGELLAGIGSQLENTVVIFVGDNGTQDRDPDDRSVSVDEHLGDDKNTTSVGAVHVPMIVADGGLLAGKSPCYLAGAPRSVTGPVHIIDLYNTVLDIAGDPKNAKLDAVSIKPSLKGEVSSRRNHNFSQMFSQPTVPARAQNIAGSVCDASYQFKLTCALSSFPGTYAYSLSKLVSEGGGHTGSFVEDEVAGAITANSDGSFTIAQTQYTSKILELYEALRVHQLAVDAGNNNALTPFPLIQPPATVKRVYVTYKGSQVGFTVRDPALNQLSYSGNGINANGVAAGPNDELYLAAADHVYRFRSDGTQLGSMNFPMINYTGVDVKGDRLYACYAGSQHGVTVRDLNLNQLAYFATKFNANGIAAGPDNDLYIAAANHVYHYKVDGRLIKDMSFPDASLRYTDVAVFGGKVYACYAGPQKGFTVRDLALNQLGFVGLSLDPSGICAGTQNDVYVSAANHVFHYTADGRLIKDMSFPNTSINYSCVAASL